MRHHALIIVVVVVCTLLSPAICNAAVFTVGVVSDTLDAAPGNGVCADSGGKCSLRAAVMEANALAGADSIRFFAPAWDSPTQITLSITGSGDASAGDLDVTEALDIDATRYVSTAQGDGIFGFKELTIAFGNQDRIFDVAAGVAVSIRSLSFNQSRADEGGAIRNAGFLTLEECNFKDVSALASGGGRGAAIYSTNSVVMKRCNVDQSTALGAGSVGGAVWAGGSFLAIDSNFRGCSAERGGALLFLSGSNVSLQSCTISGNVATFGGGIEGPGTVTLTNCTITGNRAMQGGGIRNYEGAYRLINSTVTANSTDAGGFGAGIFSQTNVAGTSLRLHNTVVAGNDSDHKASAGRDCYTLTGGSTITSDGYNLIGSNGDCSIAAATGDQIGTPAAYLDPGLAPAEWIWTGWFVPAPGSPLIDAADPSSFPARDQNGRLRPADGNGDGIARADIGSRERCCLQSRRGDANGDFRSDLFWWNDLTGDTYVWLMNGANPSALGQLHAVPDLQWKPVLVADFDGDGKTDIFWHQSNTGDAYLWRIDGLTLVAAEPAGNRSPAWTPVAAADIDGDGRADVVWRNASGDLHVWFMHGAVAVNAMDLPSVPAPWVLRAAGDFNFDGRDDLVFQHPNRFYFIWLMGETGVLRPVMPTNKFGVAQDDPREEIVAAADFDGSGTVDIVTRRAIVTFSANAARQALWQTPTFEDPSWRLVAAGDMDGNAAADTFWRYATGDDNSATFTFPQSVVTGPNVTFTRMTPPYVHDYHWRVIGPR